MWASRLLSHRRRQRCGVNIQVETVGEVYMVVAGCPEPVDNHAEKAAMMALAMMETIKLLKQERSDLFGIPMNEIEIRIGLNSGPIVAGVIGRVNPRFKLFGDTVNKASRMESTCVPGRIQVGHVPMACCCACHGGLSDTCRHAPHAVVPPHLPSLSPSLLRALLPRVSVSLIVAADPAAAERIVQESAGPHFIARVQHREQRRGPY